MASSDGSLEVPNVSEGSDTEEKNLCENVCAICDDGGDILSCDGGCLRSFHATVEEGYLSACYSLGYSDKYYREIKAKQKRGFECENCRYKQHQCFACGNLGSSDDSTGAEVFQCQIGNCGYFYHPHCVAKALDHFKYGDDSRDLVGEIASGWSFKCPLHFCYECKELEPEDKNDLETMFAICRRCPRAYHRKCLPSTIRVCEARDQEAAKDDKNPIRAWTYLMPNRILMYCSDHTMVDRLSTASRDHIKFPDMGQKKRKRAKMSFYKKVEWKKNIANQSQIAEMTSIAKVNRADSASIQKEISPAPKGPTAGHSSEACEIRNLEDCCKMRDVEPASIEKEIAPAPESSITQESSLSSGACEIKKSGECCKKRDVEPNYLPKTPDLRDAKELSAEGVTKPKKSPSVILDIDLNLPPKADDELFEMA